MAMQKPRVKYLEIEFSVLGGMELLVFPVLFQWKKPVKMSRVHWTDKQISQGPLNMWPLDWYMYLVSEKQSSS